MIFVLLFAFAFQGTWCGQPVVNLPNSQLITDVSYSGFINVDGGKQDAELFYWFFESRNQPSTDPVVLWMTGGPGCSSELAVLFENGPFTVDENLVLQPNPHSWTNNANVIFIDQPFGTGFSPMPRGDFVHNETVMAHFVYNFLQGWFKEYSSYSGRPFFITGESFAGHYIPVLASKIVAENQRGINPIINLQGVAIGNGWTDPRPQYASEEPYAVDYGLIVNGSDIDQRLQKQTQLCVMAIDNAKTLDDVVLAMDICNLILQEIVRNAPPIDGYPINHYNIKEPCVSPSLCYNFTDETNYMNLAGTLAALHVPGPWESCTTRAGLALTVDRLRAYSYELVPVLAAGVPVLVYSGVWDLICDYYGGQAWTNQMEWPGQAAFNAAPVQEWKVDGVLAGYVKTAQNLTWLEVNEAGHMVPHDQPVNALDMLTRFLNNQPFA